MGALLGIPVAAAAVGICVLFLVAIFTVCGVSIMEVVRGVLGIKPPPTEEELAAAASEKKRKEAEAEALIQKEIEMAAREARRPKTEQEARTKIAEIAQTIASAEKAVETASAEAKAAGGGWNKVAEAREALEKAKALEDEIKSDASKFGVTTPNGGMGGSATASTQPPAPTQMQHGEGTRQVAAFGSSVAGFPTEPTLNNLFFRFRDPKLFPTRDRVPQSFTVMPPAAHHKDMATLALRMQGQNSARRALALKLVTRLRRV